ncbi:hypothetical protein SVAN01_01332 [Stagonosporopsis vannaccii]|nr:hypothetical protein SVAN01_01332 [Stagonosporopsis vannaccii]
MVVIIDIMVAQGVEWQLSTGQLVAWLEMEIRHSRVRNCAHLLAARWCATAFLRLQHRAAMRRLQRTATASAGSRRNVLRAACVQMQDYRAQAAVTTLAAGPRWCRHVATVPPVYTKRDCKSAAPPKAKPTPAAIHITAPLAVPLLDLSPPPPLEPIVALTIREAACGICPLLFLSFIL